jgi:threonine dehydrogenase-like Zn-dependent dehydrogenase
VKAIVYTGPRELRYEEVKEPEAGLDEAIVQVRAVGICGSEIHGVASTSSFRVPPLVMGHEFTGICESTGERVIVNPLIPCLTCDLCRRGRPNICRKRAIVGIHRPGAFTERVAVPERSLYRAPESLSFEAGALVEPLANAVHAWQLPSDRNPQRVGIIGAGTMGLVSLLVARSHSAPVIDVADLSDDRLSVAHRLGASRVGSTLTGEFDLILDCVGIPETRRTSVELLRPGGSAIWIGLHDKEPGFDSLDLIRMEKAVYGSFCYTHADFATAVDLATRIDTTWVTTMRLSEGISVFEQLMNGRTDLLKVQLTP